MNKQHLFDVKICYRYFDKNLMGFESGTWGEILNIIKHEMLDDADILECRIVEAIDVETHKKYTFV